MQTQPSARVIRSGAEGSESRGPFLEIMGLRPTQNDPAATGLPLTYTPDTSRDDWKPRPFNQFVDGPVEGDSGVRRALEMVVAAVVA